ncbi:hypothetical protein CSKR_203928 [Clonorchis sinensis]|uniref:Uncharacterized protein n=1 Tax=Clonorchis sinensis TaxID=79923 RepID=A0A8T1MF64_CLOSI|nr:hypothetical protein CSKR_203928 [Clonorchis sinensis]
MTMRRFQDKKSDTFVTKRSRELGRKQSLDSSKQVVSALSRHCHCVSRTKVNPTRWGAITDVCASVWVGTQWTNKRKGIYFHVPSLKTRYYFTSKLEGRPVYVHQKSTSSPFQRPRLKINRVDSVKPLK